MADITTRQNESESLQLSRAQRYFYARAKRLSLVQIALAGSTPIVSAVAAAINPVVSAWTALAGIVVSLVDFGVLDLQQRRFRKLAGSIQEEFDCRVLDLEWNEPFAGPRPTPEDIHEGASEYRDDPGAPLRDWYPLAVKSLPIHQGRVICQRTNCWWDSKLRRRYATWIVAVVSAIGVFVLVVALAGGMTVEKFVLAVLAPLSPTLLWAIREVHRQRDVASALDGLKEYGRSLWNSVLSGALDQAHTTVRSRELQDAILYRRRESPFVFDWAYRRLRNKFEDQMNVGADAMVSETHGR